MRGSGHAGRLGRVARCKPYWFPDWKGQACCIIGAGPSLTKEQVEKVNHLKRIVINTSYKLAPDADALYGCDGKWWRVHKGAPEFQGIKISQDALDGYPDVKRVILEKAADGQHVNDIILKPGIIGSGGNSGFQALNLAIQFGAKKIILLGYDMHGDDGVHWHGLHPPDLHNPFRSTFEMWVKKFENVAGFIKNLDVEVINATPGSALKCFTFKKLESAIST